MRIAGGSGSGTHDLEWTQRNDGCKGIGDNQRVSTIDDRRVEMFVACLVAYTKMSFSRYTPDMPLCSKPCV